MILRYGNADADQKWRDRLLFLVETKKIEILLPYSALVGALALMLVAVWLAPPSHAFQGLAQYNWLHMTLETVAIVIAGMIFGVAWNAYSGERSGNTLVLACGLLATGILDFVHALSFAGMPDLVTPSGPEKAINFWLAARLTFAVTLIAVAVRQWRPFSRPARRHVLLAGTLAATAAVIWVGLYRHHWLPRTFTQDSGLTGFKIGAEIFLIALLAVPAALFLRQAAGARDYVAANLYAAAMVSMLSELCFTRYEDVTDIYNLLGHVYKAIAFFLVYRSVFVGSVREPFVRMVRAEAENRFRHALINSHVTAFEQDRNLKYVWVMNPALGLGTGNLVGSFDRDVFDAETAAFLEALKRDVLESGKATRQEVHAALPDGSSAWFDLHVEPSRNLRGDIIGILGTAVDVTEIKENRDALQLAALVYHNSIEAMMVTGEDERIVSVNAAFERITGHRSAEALGCSPATLLGAAGNPGYVDMRQALVAGGEWRGELWLRHRSGSNYAVAMSVNSIFNEDGSVHRRVALFLDITERKKSDEAIWRQANFDALTGLPNRRMFVERLRLEMHKARRARLPLALMFLDLDGFKHVNDSLGHEMGDALLKGAAERLRHCVRSTDTVARLGGDEFTVILAEMQDHGHIEGIAYNILRQLSEPFSLGSDLAHVSASIGIALYPQDAAELDDLIRNADQAMYAAKQGGKNRLHYFTASMQEQNEAKWQLANELRGALQADQFRVLYQPIVELPSGAIRMVEALIRWQHPSRGLISPAEFLSVAEDARLTTSFGDWIFREAVAQATHWRARFAPELLVCLNVSMAQFRNGGIDTREWLRHLRRMGLPPDALVLEVNEGAMLDAGHDVQSQLIELHESGVRLAIDDFGTARSSLQDLQKFDIGFIKIHGALVGTLAPESEALKLCEAVTALAGQLGIKVIAEGVETEFQSDFLEGAGCSYAQGYLFSGPLTPDEIEEKLKAGEPLIGGDGSTYRFNLTLPGFESL